MKRTRALSYRKERKRYENTVKRININRKSTHVIK